MWKINRWLEFDSGIVLEWVKNVNSLVVGLDESMVL